jgi:hypothetical protein
MKHADDVAFLFKVFFNQFFLFRKVREVRVV